MALRVGQRDAAAREERSTHIKLMRSRRLYGLGAIICAALVVCSRSPSGLEGPYFVVPLAVAGVAYLIAIREFLQVQQYPRHVIFACLALAVLWRIPFALMPSGPLDDVRRYVWDGRLQHLGYNPYTAIPADPALGALHTTETRGLNNPEVPSPYPPGAQLFFRSVTAIPRSAFAFRAAFIACDLMIIAVLLAILDRTGQAEHWVLAYAWHPLLATDVAASGHIDILGALLLLLSVAALSRHWRMAAAIALGLAVAVKFLPIVVAPLYWRRVRIRDVILAALVVGILYVPFFEHGHIPIGSLDVYVQRFRFNDPIFSGIERLWGAHVAAGFAVLAGLSTAVWLRIKQRELCWHAWAWPMATSLVCGPVVYSWYLLWLLPFLRFLPTLPLMLWSVSILSTYYVWHLHALAQPWQVPEWMTLAEYIPVVAAAAFVLRSSKRPDSDPKVNRKRHPYVGSEDLF